MSTGAEYQRSYRNAVPEYAERTRVYTRARGRALRRLAEKHEHDFDVLFAEELAGEGFESSGQGGPGVPKIRRNLGVKR